MFFAIGVLAFLAGIVQTVTGFGGGIVLMLGLPYFFTMVEAPAISSCICWGLNLAIAIQLRKSTEWKKIALPGVLYCSFAVLTLRVVGRLNLVSLNIAFGVFLIALAVYYMFFAKNAVIKPNLTSAVFCSVFSGICSGLFGIGGPLMALYYVQVTEDRKAYISDLQTIFSVNGLFVLATRISKGYYTASMIPVTAVGLLSILGGKVIGKKISKKMDAETFKKVVYCFVGLSGVITLVKNLI